MDGIFNSETPSFVPETELLGIGQIEKENFGLGGDRFAGTMALGLPEETTPYYIEEGQANLLLNGQNEGTGNGHFLLGGSGYLDADSGGDFMTGQTEEISQKEGGDLLTGGGLAIEKMVAEAVPTVREMLEGFAQKPEFEVEMGLAFGNSDAGEKAKVLKAALSGEYLEVLGGIEIVNRDLINGANGAFAGETETIYLAREFVWKNLGDVGAIIPVIVEEFGHYLDWEFNSIDAPGDEGEIFASFVLGEELSLPEFWGMKVEDDGAIGFLDGRMVSIERQVENVTQKDTLNFSAGGISNWSNSPIDDSRQFDWSLFNESLNLPQGQFNFGAGAVTGNWELTSGLEASVFATIGNLGSAEFSYPIDLFVSIPESVELGETFTLKTGVAQKTEDAAFSSASQVAELPNAGLKFTLNPLTAKITDVNVNTFLGQFNNVVEVEVATPRIDETIDVLGLLNGEIGDPLGVAQLNFARPEIQGITPKESVNFDSSLPEIVASGTSNNVIEGELDLDRILAFGFPVLLGLGGERKFSFLGDRISGKLSYDLLDIKQRIGLALEQEFTFDPNEINVTMALDEQTEQTGTVSDREKEYTFTAPSDGTGVLEIEAQYELTGDLRNVIGVLPRGSVNVTALQGEASLNVDDIIEASTKLGPLLSREFPEGGVDFTDAFPLIGSPAINDGDSEPLFPILNTINTSEISGEEDVTKNLIAEVTYYIPYGLPVSISDASVTEGETLEFVVTLTEPSDRPVSVDYSSEKGSGTVNFAPGETTQTIEIPTTDDRAVEETETFEITLNNPNGISFPETLPNGESTITATGTIFDDDEKPDPDPPQPNPREFNDPRYITIDGKSLEFQAAGEFTLIESVNDDYEIQIRQQPVGNNPLNNASDATAVATTLGGARVGLYKDGQQLLIDGTPTTIPDNEYIPVGDGRIYREGNVYSFIYPKGDQLIAAMTQDRINVSLFFSPERRDTVRGIFGTYNDNPDDDILKRDGTVLSGSIPLEQLYGEYADSWRISPEESLFDYQPGEDTSTYTIFNYPRKKIELSDLDPADVERAIELIGDRLELIDPNLRDGVIIDLILTGFDETVIEEAVGAGSVSAGSVSILDELDELGAKDDFAFTNSNVPVQIDVLSNDTVTPDTPLAIASFDPVSSGGGSIALDDGGTPDEPSDDQLTYTPPTNFSGTDKFQYTVFNGAEATTGLVTIVVPGLNLANLDGNNGFVLDGINPGNFSGVAVSKIGDFNGDSIDDLSIGAFAADPNGNNAAGESYVIFGTNNGFPANLDLANLDGSNGLTLQGIDIQGLSGGAVGGAGDINNDGIDDLIIGAFGAPANGNNNAGKAYVVFGNSGLPANIDLANLNGDSGFVLSGLNEFDYAGVAVGGAGDINNDGIDDLYISAPGPLSSPPSKTYIVFGSETGYPANIDLSALNGSTGFVINDSRGLAGSDVSKAGDINNDGIADLIIGADEGSGDSYVVYGSSSFPATVELSGILNGTNGSQLAATDILNPDGTTVRGVGDVNNDGIDDLTIAVSGTTVVDNLPITKGYVIFGDRSLPSRFDLSALNGSNGFVINDFSIDNILGFSIGEVGDFNRDGIDDILIGTSQADTNGNIDSGKSYVVFGKRDGNFPTNIDLARLDSRDGLVLNGVETEDLTGSAVDGAGDLNNDGISDLIVGAPGSLFNDAPGKSYVVFGSGNFGSSTTLVFDELYYLSQNPEVADLFASEALASGLEHFTRFGAGEERDFRVFLFNENSYLTQNPEVASLVASGELRSGLEHFTRFGQFEERSAGASEQSSIPLRFDENYYLNQNPDVSEAVEAGVFSSGFDHYIQVGQFQSRLTSA